MQIDNLHDMRCEHITYPGGFLCHKNATHLVSTVTVVTGNTVRIAVCAEHALPEHIKARRMVGNND